MELAEILKEYPIEYGEALFFQIFEEKLRKNRFLLVDWSVGNCAIVGLLSSPETSYLVTWYPRGLGVGKKRSSFLALRLASMGVYDEYCEELLLTISSPDKKHEIWVKRKDRKDWGFVIDDVIQDLRRDPMEWPMVDSHIEELPG